MRRSLAFGSILFALLTACSTSSSSSTERPGSGGAPSGASGAAVGGALAGGASSAESSSQAGTSSSSGATSASGSGSGGASGGTDAMGGETGAAGAASLTCGYKGQGHVLAVAPDILLCIPSQTCLPETCPPGLGSCVNGQCVFDSGYTGLQTLPEAWTTHYCDLQTGACQGVHQFDPVLSTAQALATKSNLPLCKTGAPGGNCVGIVASPPMMVGNREKYGQIWGLGLTEASGLCYQVTGPGGSALLAVTDRCGGYCKCPTLNANAYNECGQCSEASDLTPLCECRGNGNCGTQQCDWCAANNHAHFDVDDDTFNHLCGDQSFKGSCQLANVKFVPCLDPRADWPPPL